MRRGGSQTRPNNTQRPWQFLAGSSPATLGMGAAEILGKLFAGGRVGKRFRVGEGQGQSGD